MKKHTPKTLGDGDGYTLKNKKNQIKKDAAILKNEHAPWDQKYGILELVTEVPACEDAWGVVFIPRGLYIWQSIVKYARICNYICFFVRQRKREPVYQRRSWKSSVLGAAEEGQKLNAKGRG